MRILFAFLLRLFHFIHAVVVTARALWKGYSEAAPQSLFASRQRRPKHLAIIFTVASTVSDDTAQEVLTESIVNSVSWCRTLGIKKLTVYEENDLLSKCVQSIRERLPIHGQESYSSDSEIEYPITPPPSDYSQSRPLSPNLKQRTSPIATMHIGDPMTSKEARNKLRGRRPQRHDEAPETDLHLCLLSRESSKPAIATAAQDLAQTQFRPPHKEAHTQKECAFTLSVAELDQMLEDNEGLSSPDFIIIHPVEFSRFHPTPPELYGFPPWHIRLTEIYHNMPHKPSLRKWLSRGQSSQTPLPLDEISFKTAIDAFISAEMRFGK